MARDPCPLFPPLAVLNEQPALEVGSSSLDYAGLSAACALFRRVLAEVAVAPHERVAIWAHPDLDSMIGLIGSVSAGVTTVPLDPKLTERELAHILADAQPRAIFSAHPEQDRARTPDLPVYGFLAPSHSLVTNRRSEERGADEPLLVLYTSGTTGAPKGVVLTARNVASTLDALAEAWDLSERDTLVHALPLVHVHGLVFGLFGALRLGASLRYLPKFAPEGVGSALVGPSTVLYAVPTMYYRLADAAERNPELRAQLRGARLLVSGSAPLPARTHARIESLTGQRICERYGMTETMVNAAMRHDGERRAGYVGPPLPGVELRLVDEQRAPIEARDDETFGEIAVRGPNVFLGYLHRPEATLAVLDAEGWFYTGDLGTLSPDGSLRILGRKAYDLIKTGGYRVGAGEVEAALLEHPSVREAAVVGLPDEDLGQRIVAYVVTSQPQPEATALIDHVAQRLTPHKRPRELRFVDELPRNALGKVQKSELLRG